MNKRERAVKKALENSLVSRFTPKDPPEVSDTPRVPYHRFQLKKVLIPLAAAFAVVLATIPIIHLIAPSKTSNFPAEIRSQNENLSSTSTPSDSRTISALVSSPDDAPNSTPASAPKPSAETSSYKSVSSEMDTKSSIAVSIQKGEKLLKIKLPNLQTESTEIIYDNDVPVAFRYTLKNGYVEIRVFPLKIIGYEEISILKTPAFLKVSANTARIMAEKDKLFFDVSMKGENCQIAAKDAVAELLKFYQKER